jgi:anaerobic ribonucleoside-triphosphate reductase activating protein
VKLRLHATQPHSRANGPGVRYVIWVQGCTLACPGCFNPETHTSEEGYLHSTGDLAADVLAVARAGNIEGVTFSGGEPLEQSEALLEFFDALEKNGRETSNLSRILFTGWTRSEIAREARAREVLERVDAAVCGRYDRSRHAPRGVLASSNQELVLVSKRYRRSDFQAAASSEAIIHGDGTITLTGIRPLSGITTPSADIP